MLRLFSLIEAELSRAWRGATVVTTDSSVPSNSVKSFNRRRLPVIIFVASAPPALLHLRQAAQV